jgi:amidase
MARTVTDAALLLAVISGRDPRDPATASAPQSADYVAALDRTALAGARLGVVRGYTGTNDRVLALFGQALARLQALGAVIVDPVALPSRASFAEAELEVLLHEFKDGLATYLAEFAPAASIRSVADLIAFNERERRREMPYFGQELLTMADARGGLDSTAYRDALAKVRRLMREEGVDRALNEHKLDALIAPTGGPAWLIDLVNGDSHSAGFTSPAAVAGYPHITLPMGDIAGLPVGLSFVGPAWSEPKLLKFAYAFEQATQHRRPPTFARTAGLDLK